MGDKSLEEPLSVPGMVTIIAATVMKKAVSPTSAWPPQQRLQG